MASTNRFNVAGVKSGNVNFNGSLKKTYFKKLIVLLFSLLPTMAFSQEPSNGLTELFGALKQLQNAIEKGQTDQSIDMPSKDLNLGKSSGAVSATVESFELQHPIRKCLSKTKVNKLYGIYSPEKRQFNRLVLDGYKNEICDQLYNIETFQSSETQRAFPQVEYPENCIVTNNNWRMQLIEQSQNLVPENQRYKLGHKLKAAIQKKCLASITDEDLINTYPSDYQAFKEKENAETDDKQAKALEERQRAEARRLERLERQERRKNLIASISGPMLCNINGKSKPTLFLDIGVNNEFKLALDGTWGVTGKWRSVSFQGQAAILLAPPASPTDSYPDIYTAYEDSIKIAQSSITLTLARRSTFPGSGSAEAYEAACTKAKPLTLEQAMLLTRANQKNNPLRPEVITQRQQEKAYRPSDANCTRLEDIYADRPALRKRLLAEMGCN